MSSMAKNNDVNNTILNESFLILLGHASYPILYFLNDREAENLECTNKEVLHVVQEYKKTCTFPKAFPLIINSNGDVMFEKENLGTADKRILKKTDDNDDCHNDKRAFKDKNGIIKYYRMDLRMYIENCTSEIKKQYDIVATNFIGGTNRYIYQSDNLIDAREIIRSFVIQKERYNNRNNKNNNKRIIRKNRCAYDSDCFKNSCSIEHEHSCTDEEAIKNLEQMRCYNCGYYHDEDCCPGDYCT